MFHLLCRTLYLCRNECTVRAHNPSMAVSLSVRLLSDDASQHSFTVSYLIDKCGLSMESALLASEKVQLKNSHDPDKIVSFFHNHGFLKTEISEMVRKMPKLLIYNPEKTIFPKVEFFRSKYPSTIDLVKIFTSYPYLLRSSLEKQLLPSFNFIKNMLQSEEKAITVVKRIPGVLDRSLKRRLIPRGAVIEYLASKGLLKLDSSITNLFIIKERYFLEMLTGYGEEAPRLLKLYCDKLEMSPEPASTTAFIEPFDKPNSVLSFLEKMGISKTEINKMIRVYPNMISPGEEKIIFSKVDFLCAKGMMTPDLVKIFTRYPYTLTKSLENHWIPSFNFLKEWLQSDERAIDAIRQFPHILCCCPQSDMIDSINTLKKRGVPVTNILRFVSFNCNYIGMKPETFDSILDKVMERGIDSSKTQFVVAFSALAARKQPSWDQKVSSYKRWGWSDEDVIAAFKRFPCCMKISVDKIMATMDFYVNQMGLDSSAIANNPVLVGYSLKKRLIPRAAVLQFLSSKGLLNMNSSLTSVVTYTEKQFLEKFVNCHKEAPQLLKLYKEKLGSLA